MSAIRDLLVEALAHEWRDDEVAASRLPPYPLPAAIAGHAAQLLAAIDAHPTEGDGPLVALRALAVPQPFRLAARNVARPPVNLHDVACLLLSARLISIAEAEQIAATQTPKDAAGLRRQVVISHLDDGDVDAAIAATAACGENAYEAARDIDRWYARRADSTGYLALAAQYGAAKEKHGMALMRATLVGQVSIAQGWEAALALADDRRIGTAHRVDALRQLTSSGQIEQLDALEAARPDLLDELGWLLVRNQALRAVPAGHPAVRGQVERIAALDPLADRALMRRRDELLVMIVSAVGDDETFALLHGALRTPLLKRDAKAHWQRRSAAV